ncbi:PhnA-like protein [Methylobrevis albus]|nr:PhnA-like protein [Methylobrevis albus]
MTTVYTSETASVNGAVADFRRVSWGAILAGVAVALATNLVLNLLGVGIGAASLDPAGGDSAGATTLSIGAALWWTVTGIIASLVGGITAGRLAGTLRSSNGAWHGLIAWAMTTLVIFYLLTTTVGAIVGGVYSTVSGAVSSAAQTAGATASTALEAAAPSLAGTDPLGAIETEVRAASGGQDPAALRDTAVSAVTALMTGTEAERDAARDRAAQALATARQIPVDQARADVERYEQQYRTAVEEAQQQATAAADATATAVATGALFSAVSLVIGGLAGWFGGRVGARRARD